MITAQRRQAGARLHAPEFQRLVRASRGQRATVEAPDAIVDNAFMASERGYTLKRGDVPQFQPTVLSTSDQHLPGGSSRTP